MNRRCLIDRFGSTLAVRRIASERLLGVVLRRSAFGPGHSEAGHAVQGRDCPTKEGPVLTIGRLMERAPTSEQMGSVCSSSGSGSKYYVSRMAAAADLSPARTMRGDPLAISDP
jgi:hypothetical protein